MPTSGPAGGPAGPPCGRLSDVQTLEVLAEMAAKVVALERELDRRFQKPQFVARIVAPPFEAITVNGTAAEQVLQPIRQLDLTARAGSDRLEGHEDFRRQH